MKHSFLPVLFFFAGSLCIVTTAVPEGKTGAVTGRLMLKGGGPMSGGQIFFFSEASGPPPSRDKYWRIPDYVAPINDEGWFSIALPEGKYFAGAIKRTSGEKTGPPKEGDYFFASADEKGSPLVYRVIQGEMIDIGVISGAVPFKKAATEPGEITAIEGTVIDPQGKPVENALVFAYTSPAMSGKPVFASERTSKDGRYILRVHKGGSYYLKSRSVYGGGPPSAGEMIGAYGEREAAAVNVSTGLSTSAINIKVSKFPGRGSANK